MNAQPVMEYQFPIEIVDATIEHVDDGLHHWTVSGSVQGQPWWSEILKQLMATRPQIGTRYRFELTQQSAYGDPEIVAVHAPDGARYALSAQQIIDRQIDAKIEHALSEISTIGWAAGYLHNASSDAWNLVISGPCQAGQAALWNRGTPEQMRQMLTTLLTTAARRSWWPQETYSDDDRTHLTGYTKIPLAQQHQHQPVPQLAAGADSTHVYQRLATIWKLDITGDDPIYNQPGHVAQ